MERLNGYLLSWPATSGSISRDQLEQCTALKFLGTAFDSSWETFRLASSVPLLGEAPEGAPHMFHYKIHCRRSGQRILIVALYREIIDALLVQHLRQAFVPNLRKIGIKITDLVRHLVDDPEHYVLTAVHARVPAFGQSLRSLSLYGKDLANAKLFRDNLERFECQSCGIAEVGSEEIVTLGTSGRVSFLLRNPKRAKEIEAVLGYVTRYGFIDLEASSTEMSDGEYGFEG